MKLIQVHEWLPADALQLEEEALNIAKSGFNSLVIAGPGAGKTELLAQRASYLLQTNTCSSPKRILAISFKKDAAHNLRERVRVRCGEQLANRFDSYTFDAFAKQLLDRFRTTLPAPFRISTGYKICFGQSTVLDEYRSLDIDTFNSLHEKAISKFHNEFAFQPPTSEKLDTLRYKVWESLLARSPAPLTFPMMMVLANVIMSRNPKLTKYLQQTYEYVFLDEFQDTTDLQYAFFKTCFVPSNAIITAVGDDKQLIMRWAGANEEVLSTFLSDTGARRSSLKMNFRSAPRLVELQNYLVKHLLRKSDFALPSSRWKDDSGEAALIFYNNPTDETADLLARVKGWLQNDGIGPRDICILVKQQLAKYAATLIEYFNANGVKARDESVLQDLVANVICQFVLDVLYVGFGGKQQERKSRALIFLSNIKTETLDFQLLKIEKEFAVFLRQLRTDYSRDFDEKDTASIVASILEYAGRERLCAAYMSHCNLSELLELEAILVGEISKYQSQTNDILEAIDGLIGVDSIPIMTIHKSKGLEYHTVVFIGLEDKAFWSYATQADEDQNTFFVALSRAKQRVVFTFSGLREGRYGRMETQSLKAIEELFDHLRNSSLVESIDNRT